MVAATIPGAQTERRGGAGPVRGLLGGKDLTGRLVLVISQWSVVRSKERLPADNCLRPTDLSEITSRNYFPASTRAQGLQHSKRYAVAHEAHGAVGEGEVGAARMAAAEGADPILHRAFKARSLSP
jgi:hypothetical protein